MKNAENSSATVAELTCLTKGAELSLYESSPGVFIASTPFTRKICNDPFVSGMEYTSSLEKAGALVIAALQKLGRIALTEKSTTIVNILRGGLNFGLRSAVHSALGFNDHSSAYLSAQRARSATNPNEWIITESDYQKLELLPQNQVVFGDVVATGTSLQYALKKLLSFGVKHSCSIESLLFFTIGGPRSHELVAEANAEYRKTFPTFRDGFVVYFEGIFPVASNETPMRIKLDGTDLIRTGGVFAPEFITSQYESPSYPLERCTIYDAGSRAFNRIEYYTDVLEYWEQVLALAKSGVTFAELVSERCKEIDSSRFGAINLTALCEKQIAGIKQRL